jgi:hypothetical protein
MRTFAEKPKAIQQATPAKSTVPNRALFSESHELNSILHLQRTIGNQAVQRLLQANPEGLDAGSATTASTRFGHDFSRIPVYSKSELRLQAKLAVNTPGDIYEQEADRVAELVTSMPGPRLQRTCACGGGCPNCQNEQTAHVHLQTKRVSANHSGAISAPPIVHEVIRSHGQPLDATTREFMEPRFGHDFSRVRLHTDSTAAESTRAVNALAYTAGDNIVFAAGQFAPYTSEGRKLLAHELTHVLQNNQGAVRRQAAGPHPSAAVVQSPVEATCTGEADEGQTFVDNYLRGGIGTIDNQTQKTFDACASETKGCPKKPIKLGHGEWGDDKLAIGACGEKLKDMDFVFPSSTNPINGQTAGTFKIGSNASTLSPDPANSKCSKIDNFSWYSKVTFPINTCDF